MAIKSRTGEVQGEDPNPESLVKSRTGEVQGEDPDIKLVSRISSERGLKLSAGAENTGNDGLVIELLPGSVSIGNKWVANDFSFVCKSISGVE